MSYYLTLLWGHIREKFNRRRESEDETVTATAPHTVNVYRNDLISDAGKMIYSSITSVDYKYYSLLLGSSLTYIYYKLVSNLPKPKSRSVYDDYCVPRRLTKKLKSSCFNSKSDSRSYHSKSNSSNLDDIENLEVICNICLERLPDRVLIPCGHVFCTICLSEIGTCPTCRSNINGVMKIFL